MSNRPKPSTEGQAGGWHGGKPVTGPAGRNKASNR